jgi:hypothetical protein
VRVVPIVAPMASMAGSGQGRGQAVRYYTNCGPEKSPVKHRDVPGSIGVLEAPDNHLPIGAAHGVT